MLAGREARTAVQPDADRRGLQIGPSLVVIRSTDGRFAVSDYIVCSGVVARFVVERDKVLSSQAFWLGRGACGRAKIKG